MLIIITHIIISLIVGNNNIYLSGGFFLGTRFSSSSSQGNQNWICLRTVVRSAPYSSKYLMPPLEFENCPQRFRYINYILFIYYYYTVWLEMITLRN
ncbi:hypothetical protein M432DRAFT_208692 [Thermoascus aurantiacus ATCC 26904]